MRVCACARACALSENSGKFGMEKFQYFMCAKCKRPYFGGMPSCQEGERNDAGYNPNDLVCGGCSGTALATQCPKHGTDFIEFKCQFCCKVGNWFCWGKVHFCDDCHTTQVKGNYLTRKPKNYFPVCPGPQQCPLRVAHPHVEEFSLGCSICRAADQF